jgi:hypothetical protein
LAALKVTFAACPPVALEVGSSVELPVVLSA